MEIIDEIQFRRIGEAGMSQHVVELAAVMGLVVEDMAEDDDVRNRFHHAQRVAVGKRFGEQAVREWGEPVDDFIVECLAGSAEGGAVGIRDGGEIGDAGIGLLQAARPECVGDDEMVERVADGFEKSLAVGVVSIVRQRGHRVIDTVIGPAIIAREGAVIGGVLEVHGAGVLKELAI